MTLGDFTATHRKAPTESDASRQELVGRVASSATFEKSPKLRAFFLHVSRCALEERPEEATEQQIGIHVYGRPAAYNPNEDNIVRSQARMLRMKLEHHFANEGKSESMIITIPARSHPGRSLPKNAAFAVDLEWSGDSRVCGFAGARNPPVPGKKCHDASHSTPANLEFGSRRA
jgi:hypothetical protein